MTSALASSRFRATRSGDAFKDLDDAAEVIIAALARLGVRFLFIERYAVSLIEVALQG